MSKKWFVWIALFSVAALASGCVTGPNFHSPEAPAAAGYTQQPLTATASSPNVPGGEEQRFVSGMEIPQKWWVLFESAPLNALLEKSTKTNPTLDAAKAALCQSQELTAAQRDFFYPTVQGYASASRQNNALETLAPTLTSGETYFTLYTAQFTLSYMPDVFGLNGGRSGVGPNAANLP